MICGDNAASQADLQHSDWPSSVDTDDHHSENEGIIDYRPIDHDHPPLKISTFRMVDIDSDPGL